MILKVTQFIQILVDFLTHCHCSELSPMQASYAAASKIRS